MLQRENYRASNVEWKLWAEQCSQHMEKHKGIYIAILIFIWQGDGRWILYFCWKKFTSEALISVYPLDLDTPLLIQGKGVNPLPLKEGGAINRRIGDRCRPLCEEVNGNKNALGVSIFRCWWYLQLACFTSSIRTQTSFFVFKSKKSESWKRPSQLQTQCFLNSPAEQSSVKPTLDSASIFGSVAGFSLQQAPCLFSSLGRSGDLTSASPQFTKEETEVHGSDTLKVVGAQQSQNWTQLWSTLKPDLTEFSW